MACRWHWHTGPQIIGMQVPKSFGRAVDAWHVTGNGLVGRSWQRGTRAIGAGLLGLQIREKQEADALRKATEREADELEDQRINAYRSNGFMPLLKKDSQHAGSAHNGHDR
jgi:hypothetical protein